MMDVTDKVVKKATKGKKKMKYDKGNGKALNKVVKKCY